MISVAIAWIVYLKLLLCIPEDKEKLSEDERPILIFINFCDHCF